MKEKTNRREFLETAEAEAYLHRKYRKGWTL